MSLLAFLILVTLLADFALALVADLLDLRAQRHDLPAEFVDVYDADAYRSFQKYTRQSTHVSLAASSFELAVLLVFWFAGGFQIVDAWVRGFGLGSVATGVVYIAVLVLAKAATWLPSRLYSFVVDERFGFNRAPLRVLVTDLAAGLVLVTLLGVPVLAAVLVFFERAGEAAWLYGWILSTVFLVVVHYAFPKWILPFAHRLEPLAEGELRGALAAYTQSVGLSLPDVFVIDSSRRRSRANAFLTGFGSGKRVGLSDTLIEKSTVAEVVAVFAQQVGITRKIISSRT